MTCGECRNVTAPGAGFQNHVYCKRFLLHMEKREDASRCRDFIPNPITNADHIRSMTDEELAEFMDNGCDVIAPSENCTKAFYDCKKCWLEWLKQEAADKESEK